MYNKGIGLMSGTSLDGLDIALIDFSLVNQSTQKFKIEAAITVGYPHKIHKGLIDAPGMSGIDLQKFEIEYTSFIAQAVREFHSNQKSQAQFLACHGHTIFHEPNRGLTLQLLNGAKLAAETGILTVCDFRSTDVALGGQGAPLVPIGDKMLFGDYAACLNLGGFANISYEKNIHQLAFDICAVNTVLNKLASHLGLEFDTNGEIAKTTLPDESLIEKLDSIPYYAQKPPKSLGREWVEKVLEPLLIGDPKALISSFTEHAARQIGSVIKNKVSPGKILCTGGGTHNSHLMERISFHAERKISIPPKELIDFKEALIFALLGKLRLEGKINTMKSVTGASRDSIGGAIYLP